jgi:hypothetical protein
MENEKPVIIDTQTIDRNGDNDENHRVSTDETRITQNGEHPQLLSSPSHHDTRSDETPREALASKPINPVANPQRPKFNNKNQSRHWNFTFNNYTQSDYDQIKAALLEDESLDIKSRKIVSAIIAKEVGENGTPHLQSYINFKAVQRQQAVFRFFGYKTPCFHLQHQDIKRSPPLASFRYCMKGENYYVVGKNLD